MGSEKTGGLTALGKHAEALRNALGAAEQNELLAAAVEAGCLAAFGDLEVDEGERRAIIDAAGALSSGAVVEWEADSLVDDCVKRIADEGIEARVAAVGGTLKRLGHPGTGIVFAVFVAGATGGVDRLEHGVLEGIAEEAGLPSGELAAILAKAGADAPPS
jgi:tellurite resistance protein